MRTPTMLRGCAALGLISLSLLAGCGGGGGGSSTPSSTPSDPSPSGSDTASYGPAGPSASFAQQCAATNTLAPATRRTATLDVEKRWIRAYVDEAYLWPDEVNAVNPAGADFTGSDAYTALDHYFEALKSTKLTETGARRDRFSFTIPTSDWEALTQSGVEAGYGIGWAVGSPTPPRQIRVAYLEPGSPGAQAGLQRGDELVRVDDVDADVNDRVGVEKLNDALFPNTLGLARSFTLRRGDKQFTLSLSGKVVPMTPVPSHSVKTLANGGKMGYLLFNDHILPAEGQLIQAMQDFQQQGVTELALDLRYNGGGYLFIASELAYMVAGKAKTQGATFEALKYSSKRSAQNEATPFYDTACLVVNGDCTANNQPLPSLNLQRLYVLTSSRTCSASEAVINGLRGVDIDVVLIGGTTCGKPYGFTAKDNCGISYFPIEFAGVNAKGFGDYSDGFTPGSSNSGRTVRGCKAADDFAHALGDPAEGLLATAMSHAATGSCPAAASLSQAVRQAQAGRDAVAFVPRRSPGRENRILGVR